MLGIRRFLNGERHSSIGEWLIMSLVASIVLCVGFISLGLKYAHAEEAPAVAPEAAPAITPAKPAVGGVGRAVNVSGKVLIRNEVSKQVSQIRELKVGDSLYEGDLINTSSGASAKILMADRTIIDVGPTTVFKVEEFKLGNNVKERQVDLSMQYGKIRTLVSQKLNDSGKFKVHTRSATMGVRGTEFLVMSDVDGVSKKDDASKGTQTQVVVLEGKVAVDTPKEAKAGMPAVPSAPVMLTKGTAITVNVQSSGADALKGGGGEQGTRTVASASSVQVQTAQLSESQVSQSTQAVKIQDSTFEKAVTIDQNSGSNSSPSNDSFSAIASAVVIPAEVAPKPHDMGVPGAFGNDLGLGAGFFPGVTGNNVKLRVVFGP